MQLERVEKKIADKIGTVRVVAIYNDTEVSRFIAGALHGVTVERCHTFSEAEHNLNRRGCHMIVSDTDVAGVEPATYLRWIERHMSRSKIPVLFFSKRTDMERTLRILEMGAEYLAAPIHPLEFRARALKHIFTTEKKEKQELDEHVFGPIRLNATQQSCAYICPKSPVCQPRPAIKLTPTEFRLLFFLLRNEDATVSRQEIHAAVWGKDIHIRIRAIDKHMHSLKNKITDCHLSIECVYGKGYRLSILDRFDCNGLRRKSNDCFAIP